MTWEGIRASWTDDTGRARRTHSAPASADELRRWRESLEDYGCRDVRFERVIGRDVVAVVDA